MLVQWWDLSLIFQMGTRQNQRRKQRESRAAAAAAAASQGFLSLHQCSIQIDDAMEPKPKVLISFSFHVPSFHWPFTFLPNTTPSPPLPPLTIFSSILFLKFLFLFFYILVGTGTLNIFIGTPLTSQTAPIEEKRESDKRELSFLLFFCFYALGF